jgi:hypothetical protein
MFLSVVDIDTKHFPGIRNRERKEGRREEERKKK